MAAIKITDFQRGVADLEEILTGSTAAEEVNIWATDHPHRGPRVEGLAFIWDADTKDFDSHNPSAYGLLFACERYLLAHDADHCDNPEDIRKAHNIVEQVLFMMDLADKDKSGNG